MDVSTGSALLSASERGVGYGIGWLDARRTDVVTCVRVVEQCRARQLATAPELGLQLCTETAQRQIWVIGYGSKMMPSAHRHTNTNRQRDSRARENRLAHHPQRCVVLFLICVSNEMRRLNDAYIFVQM